jgi:hypothetical protein
MQRKVFYKAPIIEVVTAVLLKQQFFWHEIDSCISGKKVTDVSTVHTAVIFRSKQEVKSARTVWL